LPEHLTERTLAPVHAFVPDAARGEVSQVRRSLAVARAEHGAASLPPEPRPEPGKTIHNAYLLPSPGSAIEKMSSRLVGKEPMILSKAQFEKNGAVLPRATAAPPVGKVTYRVFAVKGLVEIQLPSHSELITLDLSPGVPVNEAQLRRSIGDMSQQLFEGPRRPDRIQQMPDGTFKIQTGSIQVIDPRADRIRRATDRRVVMKAPRRPHGAGRALTTPRALRL
jgi:hypothetical protein